MQKPTGEDRRRWKAICHAWHEAFDELSAASMALTRKTSEALEGNDIIPDRDEMQALAALRGIEAEWRARRDAFIAEFQR